MDTLTIGVKDACAALQIGRTTLYRLMSEGLIRKVKIGRKTLVTVESVRALVGTVKCHRS